jgi:glycosyltransferase involved in cell wall biosynthesis
MVYEMYPEYFPLHLNISVRKKLLCQKAAKIITISESTKRDLMNLFQIDEEKISVIYLANSLQHSNTILENNRIDNLPNKYLLYVGNRTVYKNFYFFLRAMTSILEEDKDLHIVCTGPEFDFSEKHFFKSLNLQERLVHHFVDDTKLIHLYKHALAFVFPSLFEGFGLPVLEAFSCNCPTIISNTTSLPEVGGDASMYFEPKNEQSIRDAIINVIYSNSKRFELITKGQEQLKKFSWKKTAEETAALYREVYNL